jgi:hypothetical protein
MPIMCAELSRVRTGVKNTIEGAKLRCIEWNLWIATLRNEDILWNKDTSSGPKLLSSVQIALWNEDTS